MKIALKIASILSWFNIIFWGLVVAILLMGGLSGANLPILAGTVLLSAVPLNCFASLKLQASIRRPQLPLSHQTPVGIRFVGFIALFFGISWLFYGVSMIHDPKTAATAWMEQMDQVPGFVQQYPQLKNLPESSFVHTGIAIAILGLLVGINVVLNMRLMRWYNLVKKSDIS